MNSTGTHIAQAGTSANTFELTSTGLLWNSKQIATTDQIAGGGGDTDLSHYVGNVLLQDRNGAYFALSNEEIALYNANSSEDITHTLTVDSIGCYV
jgi:hypothetical protein